MSSPTSRRDPRALLREAAARLAEAGVASPEYDAAELLAHVLGTTRGRLPLVDAVDAGQRRRLRRRWSRRRAAREPLQHLTGIGRVPPRRAAGRARGLRAPARRPSCWPAGRSSGPRRARGRSEPRSWSTCAPAPARSPLSVADEVPGAEVHAVELDPAAHAWAERNLAGSGVDLRLGDMADAFPDLDGTVDVVVCNPPYIPLEALSQRRPRGPRPRPGPRAVVGRGRARRDAGARGDGRPAAAPRWLGRGRARRRAGRVGGAGVPRQPAAGPRCATTGTWQVVRAT